MKIKSYILELYEEKDRPKKFRFVDYSPGDFGVEVRIESDSDYSLVAQPYGLPILDCLDQPDAWDQANAFLEEWRRGVQLLFNKGRFFSLMKSENYLVQTEVHDKCLIAINKIRDRFMGVSTRTEPEYFQPSTAGSAGGLYVASRGASTSVFPTLTASAGVIPAVSIPAGQTHHRYTP